MACAEMGWGYDGGFLLLLSLCWRWNLGCVFHFIAILQWVGRRVLASGFVLFITVC